MDVYYFNASTPIQKRICQIIYYTVVTCVPVLQTKPEMFWVQSNDGCQKMTLHKSDNPVSCNVQLILQLQPVWFLPACMRFFWKNQKSLGVSTFSEILNQISSKSKQLLSDKTCRRMQPCPVCIHLTQNNTHPVHHFTLKHRKCHLWWYSVFTSVHHCDLKKHQHLIPAASSASFPDAAYEVPFSILTSSPSQQAS